jgi:hypothetical protein
LAVLLAPVPAFAVNPFGDVCKNDDAGSSTVCKDKSTENPLTGSEGLILKVTRIVAAVAGAVAVIMIVVAGIKYITSQGDSNQTSEAKRTIIYSIVGLIVIILAQALIGFVIGSI